MMEFFQKRGTLVGLDLALRAMTIEAAYSIRLENEVGSIVPGKLANFTILADNPVTIDPMKIKDIKVWGTVQEGRVLPVAGPAPSAASSGSDRGDAGRAAVADGDAESADGVRIPGPEPRLRPSVRVREPPQESSIR